MSETQTTEASEAAARAAHQARRAAMEAKPFDANLGDLVERFCKADPAAVAWVFFDSGEILTRRDVFDRVTRLASSLSRIGVGKGTHVALMMPNISAFPVTWLALARLGAVMIPVNVRYTTSELGYVLTDSEAEFLVIDGALLGIFNALEARPPALTNERTIVHGEGGDPGTHRWDDLLTKGTSGYAPPWSVTADDLMNIQYTSGTTGFPKGCMQPQRYWLTMGRVAAHRDGLELKNILIAQPFFYMDPQWLTLMAMEQGGTTYVAAQPSITRFMDWVHRYHIHFCIFPELVYRQAEKADDGKSALRRIATYGHTKSIHADLQRRFNVVAREGFGMTEVGSALSVPLEATHMVGSGVCGVPSAFRECRVVDEKGDDVQQGEIGELVVRGPGLFKGYYKKPEANAASFFGDWFRTGDLFFQDRNGYFTIVGRLKDMIRRSGENIAAREVEAALVTIEGVKDAAAVPVRDPARGEEVKAYIVLKPGYSRDKITPDVILGEAARTLAAFKVPRYLEYVEDLPRTPSQKIKKDVLKALKPDPRLGSWDRVDKVWR
jgi:acyl-CoA synthetase (AMP-forming)/AMP-acid ligase II